MSDEETRQERAFRLLAGRPPAGASALLGLRPLEIDPERGFARIGYTARPEFCNPLGVIQGGFLSAMVDEAMAIACVASADFEIFVPTLELKVSFLRSGYPGSMVAEGQVVRLGRSIAFLEGCLYDEGGELIVTASATAKVTRREKVEAGRAAG